MSSSNPESYLLLPFHHKEILKTVEDLYDRLLKAAVNKTITDILSMIFAEKKQQQMIISYNRSIKVGSVIKCLLGILLVEILHGLYPHNYAIPMDLDYSGGGILISSYS
ncbi:MAG: hypothetical protein WA421_04275 [Nitrososphaeraceae archaeon]